MYYNQLLIHADKKMKSTWSIIKRETGKKCLSEHLPTLFKNENTLIHPNQAADGFNNYFSSLIERLNLTSVQTDSAIL